MQFNEIGFFSMLNFLLSDERFNPRRRLAFLPFPIRHPDEILVMRHLGATANHLMQLVADQIKIGVSTAELDVFFEELARKAGVRPALRKQCGFPAALSISVNHVITHGLPSKSLRLVEGDILKIDTVLESDGLHIDIARTFPLGDISEEAMKVIHASALAREAGIKAVRPDVNFSEVAIAIGKSALEHECVVLGAFNGHGIGRAVYEEYEVSHTCIEDKGKRFLTGMTLTIEPVIASRPTNTCFLGDGWSIASVEGVLSAFFEDTVLVTETGVETLTESKVQHL